MLTLGDFKAAPSGHCLPRREALLVAVKVIVLTPVTALPAALPLHLSAGAVHFLASPLHAPSQSVIIISVAENASLHQNKSFVKNQQQGLLQE